MIQTLNGAFTMIPLIVAIYYAGELVWRGREQRVQELVDATPAPDWAFVLPKVLALALVLMATVAAGILAAIVVQMFRGYTDSSSATISTGTSFPGPLTSRSSPSSPYSFKCSCRTSSSAGS